MLDMLPERVLAHIYFEPNTGCWLWGGSVSRGYGRFRLDGRTRGAHRAIYEILVGKVPDGLELDHLCRMPCCVNPEHLEPVTGRENVLRSSGLAAINAKKEFCPRGHPYDLVRDSGRKRGRACSICSLEQTHAYRARLALIPRPKLLNRANTTGYTGVDLFGNRYRAQMRANGKRIHIGLFDTAEQASEAYQAAKKALAEKE